MKTLIETLKLPYLGNIDVLIEKTNGELNVLTDIKGPDEYTATVYSIDGKILIQGSGLDAIEAINDFGHKITGALFAARDKNFQSNPNYGVED